MDNIIIIFYVLRSTAQYYDVHAWYLTYDHCMGSAYRVRVIIFAKLDPNTTDKNYTGCLNERIFLIVSCQKEIKPFKKILA